MFWIYVAAIVFGYLLGSLPTGYLVGRRYGIDIREHGSRNMGATNVVRVLGKRPGYLVFFCDAIKGLLAVRLAVVLVGFGIRDASAHGFIAPVLDATPFYAWPHTLMEWKQRSDLASILAGLACILGHNFPVWLRFRGGKGVATTVGVILGLMPAAFAIAAVAWIVSFYTTRYVSLASLIAAAVLPVSVWWLTRGDGPASGFHAPMFWFSVAAALLIFWRHRTNIVRLLDGTEHRFDRKPPAA